MKIKCNWCGKEVREEECQKIATHFKDVTFKMCKECQKKLEDD